MGQYNDTGITFGTALIVCIAFIKAGTNTIRQRKA